MKFINNIDPEQVCTEFQHVLGIIPVDKVHNPGFAGCRCRTGPAGPAGQQSEGQRAGL